MVQVVESLPSKHQFLNSNISMAKINKQINICLGYIVRPCLKKKKQKKQTHKNPNQIVLPLPLLLGLIALEWPNCLVAPPTLPPSA
jgi:hypothetical protein